MAKATTKDSTSYKDLSGKSLKELLEIRDALAFLASYYENYATANTGNYPYDTQEIYDSAKDLSAKYSKASVHVIKVIEEKIKDELYA